ncbi:SGNH/GDSL hydrolase family protein [Streptomyces sp. MST-110588]|uniref:SGNH/GDSL hydrolase family protein n=1 Tax=Streptomyces sp. MST-110588 TaxID=2833628 RepID=UPI001F5D0E28|nr:SGNH/GDSL hydrolase family protein [Streptomyces sp. MST-110588]UNO41534.1 hypothetical protein KGS77_20650 [Streptomyces sp. MST-110588]
MRTSVITAVCFSMAAAAGALALTPRPAAAGSTGAAAKDTAAVSLGDSFISGEAGRWYGNATGPDSKTDLWGTDGAVKSCDSTGTNCVKDRTLVYDNSSTLKCHRSLQVAEIVTANLPDIKRRVNLACSGAISKNIWRDGTKQYPPEETQNARLEQTAQLHNVKLIVLSVGGNDLKFSKIIKECAEHYVKFWRGECHTSAQEKVKKAIGEVEQNVKKTINDVRKVMEDAKYKKDSYRFILQSYPSPLPGKNNFRGYTGRYDRIQHGCPFHSRDAEWARNELTKDLSERYAKIVDAVNKDTDRTKVRFLDLRDALNGHEACNLLSREASSANNRFHRIAPAESDWVRSVDYQEKQGETDESMHPNAYGQMALGVCLGRAYSLNSDARCTAVPRQGLSAIRVEKKR